MMTSGTKHFYVCSFPFSSMKLKIILHVHQWVSSFVFLLYISVDNLMQSWILLIFPMLVAVGT